MMGRSAIAPVGNGHAIAWFWYGQDVSVVSAQACNRAWRWDDGDQVLLYDGTTQHVFTYVRNNPGAGQFNSPDGFLALVNATSQFTAQYAPYQNDFSSVSKMMIQIFAAAAGSAGNNMQLDVRRYITPTDTTTYLTVPQPYITGQYLNNKRANEHFCHFYGGCDGAITKTFVPSVLASTARGAFVQGVDSTSQALQPIIYLADVVPGVGATVTHLDATSAQSAKFMVRW